MGGGSAKCFLKLRRGLLTQQLGNYLSAVYVGLHDSCSQVIVYPVLCIYLVFFDTVPVAGSVVGLS